MKRWEIKLVYLALCVAIFANLASGQFVVGILLVVIFWLFRLLVEGESL